MVQKEIHQAEGTIIIENLIRMSSEHGVLLTIYTKAGNVYTGIWKTLINLLPVGTGGTPAIYLRHTADDERHACVPLDNIDSIEFTTEPGFLDNLIE
jgi:hypothetical protein